jgi:superfamily I DNA/RNA helicase
MLHALVGDRPDGLLLVGDGQQSIYPGGCSLAEAGISVVGRSSILQRNYRNRAEILRYALSLIDDDDFDDLDGVSQRGRRVIEIEHDGGEVVIDRSGEEEALVRHLQWLHVERGVRYGDMAVLVPHQSGVSRSCSQLRKHGLPFVHLTTYDGAPCEAVKIGTVHRAKGLDFAHVSIPDTDQLAAARRPGESDDAYQERRLLERRELFVALTRARDSVWLAGLDPVNDDADA